MNVSRRIYKEHGLTDINRGSERHSFIFFGTFTSLTSKLSGFYASIVTLLL